MNELQVHLQRLKASHDAIEWAKDYDDPIIAWRSCSRGHWLLWLAGMLNIDRKVLVLAACACARLALPYTTDDRPLRAIEMAEHWAQGDPNVNLEMVMQAADAAAASYAVEKATTAAANVAYAAYAAAYTAVASYAVYAATFTAAASYAVYAAYDETLLKCADLIRQRIDEATIVNLWHERVRQMELQEAG